MVLILPHSVFLELSDRNHLGPIRPNNRTSPVPQNNELVHSRYGNSFGRKGVTCDFLELIALALYRKKIIVGPSEVG